MAFKDITIRIGADTRRLVSGLSRADNALGKFRTTLNQFGPAIGGAVVAGLGAIGTQAVQTAADFEKLRASIRVLVGAGADDFFKQLQDFSARTPFNFDDIANGAKQLLAFGFSTNEAKDALQFLGDIAAATNYPLTDFTRILGQARGIGVAFKDDLNQLADRGVPVFDLLTERTGLTGKALNDFIAGSNVTFELLQDLLRSTGEEGGKFFGGLAVQSETLAGKFTTLEDNINLALGELGEFIIQEFNVKDAVDAATEAIQRATDTFKNDFAPVLKDIIGEASAVGEAISDMLSATTEIGVIDFAVNRLEDLRDVLTSIRRLTEGDILGGLTQGFKTFINSSGIGQVYEVITGNRLFNTQPSGSRGAGAARSYNPFGIPGLPTPQGPAAPFPVAEVVASRISGINPAAPSGGGFDTTTLADAVIGLETLNLAQSQSSELSEVLAGSFDFLAGSIDNLALSANIPTAEIPLVDPEFFQGIAEGVVEYTNNMERLVLVADIGASVFNSFFDALIGGENVFAALKNAILGVVKQLVQAVATAAALAAIFSIFSGGVGGLGAVKGFLGIGGGQSLFGGLLKNVLPFAEGGIVTGPTLGLIGEAGPEAVIPLNRLNEVTGNGSTNLTGEFTIRGQDLVLLLDQMNERNNRIQ